MELLSIILLGLAVMIISIVCLMLLSWINAINRVIDGIIDVLNKMIERDNPDNK